MQSLLHQSESTTCESHPDTVNKSPTSHLIASGVSFTPIRNVAHALTPVLSSAAFTRSEITTNESISWKRVIRCQSAVFYARVRRLSRHVETAPGRYHHLLLFTICRELSVHGRDNWTTGASDREPLVSMICSYALATSL